MAGKDDETNYDSEHSDIMAAYEEMLQDGEARRENGNLTHPCQGFDTCDTKLTGEPRGPGTRRRRWPRHRGKEKRECEDKATQTETKESRTEGYDDDEWAKDEAWREQKEEDEQWETVGKKKKPINMLHQMNMLLTKSATLNSMAGAPEWGETQDVRRQWGH